MTVRNQFIALVTRLHPKSDRVSVKLDACSGNYNIVYQPRCNGHHIRKGDVVRVTKNGDNGYRGYDVVAVFREDIGAEDDRLGDRIADEIMRRLREESFMLEPEWLPGHPQEPGEYLYETRDGERRRIVAMWHDSPIRQGGRRKWLVVDFGYGPKSTFSVSNLEGRFARLER